MIATAAQPDVPLSDLPLDEQLIEAARAGNVQAVEQLLSQGAGARVDEEALLVAAVTPNGAPALETLLAGRAITAMGAVQSAGCVVISGGRSYVACCVLLVRLLHYAMQEFDAIEVGQISRAWVRNACTERGPEEVKTVISSMLEVGQWHRPSLLDQALVLAAQGGRLENVVYLIDQGATIGCSNHAALCAAVDHGHTEVVEALVRAGADVHARKDYAVRHAAIRGNADMVKSLLVLGADPDTRGLMQPWESPFTDPHPYPSGYALRSSAAVLILSAREAAQLAGRASVVDVFATYDARNDPRHDPAHGARGDARQAVHHARASYAPTWWDKRLLDVGFGDPAFYQIPNLPGWSGKLVDAVRSGPATRVRSELANAAAIAGDIGEVTTRLTQLEFYRNWVTFEVFLEQGLLSPSQHAHMTEVVGADAPPEWCERLIDAGLDIASHGHRGLVAAIDRLNHKVIESFAARGVDIHDIDGLALCEAARLGNAAAVGTLLRLGADVEARGGTPLLEAALRGHTAVVVLLLKHGADPHVRGEVIDSETQAGREMSAREMAELVGSHEVAAILGARIAQLQLVDQGGPKPDAAPDATPGAAPGDGAAPTQRYRLGHSAGRGL